MGLDVVILAVADVARAGSTLAGFECDDLDDCVRPQQSRVTR
ncbi:MAG TPA: hypothetical protein VFC99_02140 [Acidimicrobiia bacterium]|nr:hypothetical protein [Acidimicrobiia bacterium]